MVSDPVESGAWTGNMSKRSAEGKIEAYNKLRNLGWTINDPTVTETFAPLDQILGQTDALLAERGSTHGDYLTQAAVTQAIKAAMRTGPNWTLMSDMQRDALEMIAVKQGRILCGDPDFQDHWDDLEGYARLGGGRK